VSSTTSSSFTVDEINSSADKSETTIEQSSTLASVMNDEEKEEILDTLPSQIDEVYVKYNGENIEENLITSSIKPEKYAPRFCLKLKFNCKLRSTHACCKYPLPPQDIKVPTTTAKTKAVKRPVRPSRIGITSNVRKSSLRRPLRQKESTTNKSVDIDTVKAEKYQEKNRRKVQLRTKLKRPSFNPVRKSTAVIKRRRQEYGSANKSPVCRIINCKRNKNHKCCQKPDDEEHHSINSETVDKTTEDSPQENSVTEKSKDSIEYPTEYTPSAENQKANVSSSEILGKNNNDSETDTIVIHNTSPPLKTDIVSPVKEQIITMIYETTTNIMEYYPTDMPEMNMQEENIETNNTMNEDTITHNHSNIHNASLDLNFNVKKTNSETKENKDAIIGQETAKNQLEEEKGYTMNTTNKVNNVNVFENKTVQSFEDQNLATKNEPKNKTGVPNNEKDTEAIVSIIENIEITTTEEPIITTTSLSILDSTENDVITPVDEVEYYEYILDTKESLWSEPQLIPQPNNSLEKEALDPNQILPRVAVECFRFDCISNPDDKCCRPHTTKKRQTSVTAARDSSPKVKGMEKILKNYPGKVTATVTRVQKTVRW